MDSMSAQQGIEGEVSGYNFEEVEVEVEVEIVAEEQQVVEHTVVVLELEQAGWSIA